ncbi:hypothetical protein GWI33_014856 [Rhynchophorus ferrugineus]|uniref:Uncharacterized protein n=1 Tax=Rhynchophorus ferrugineus TaxID=354439 RepID=A0A834MAA5_RHYFE|nr:hypothetical protein GWI33_014856 [Rhynchophorus ferrugineus]
MRSDLITEQRIVQTEAKYPADLHQTPCRRCSAQIYTRIANCGNNHKWQDGGWMGGWRAHTPLPSFSTPSSPPSSNRFSTAKQNRSVMNCSVAVCGTEEGRAETTRLQIQQTAGN